MRGIDILRLLARYYVFLLPLFVALASASFYYTVRAQYQHDWERHAMYVARNLNIDLLRRLKSSRGECLAPSEWEASGVLPDVDEIARHHLRTLDVTRINIFSDERRVVYSTEPGLAGRVSQDNTKLERALRGEVASDIEEASQAPDFPDAGHRKSWLETYVPLRLLDDSDQPTGELVGSFEVYQNIEEMNRGLAALVNWILVGSVGVLAALGLVLLGVGRRVAQLVQRERDEQHRLGALLQQSVEHLEDEVDKRTAEVLTERKMLATVFDKAPSAFVLLDGEGRIEYASQQFINLAGVETRGSARGEIERSDISGKLCSDVWQCEPNGHLCAALGAMQENAPNRILSNKPSADGTARWFEHIAVPVHVDGSSVRVIEMITDVTERRQAEEQLASAGRLATTGELAAAVAHEVRNAATGTKLFLQRLEERQLLGKSDSRSLKASLASVSRMEALVENLLRLARPARPEMVPLDVVESLRSAVELVRPEAHRRRVRIAGPDAAASLSCLGDWALLTEAFVNLLLNAVQAFDEPSGVEDREVTLQARVVIFSLAPQADHTHDATVSNAGLTPHRSDLLPSSDGGAQRWESGSRVAIVEISDNGSGLPAADVNRVFEPFFTTKPNGTGLGVPIVRRIVEGHGGTLTLLPRPGRGTIARVLLPTHG